MPTGFETIFLAVVGLLALLIILGTVVAVIIVLRRPSSQQPAVGGGGTGPLDSSVVPPDITSATQTTRIPTPIEDVEAWLAEQRNNLTDFDLQEVSNTFKGTTNEGQRTGVILHLTEEERALVAFTGQVFSPQNGAISAETVYGTMEMTVAQGKAVVQWNGETLGVLEFGKQRILGPEGGLLGTMERPTPGSEGNGYYPISFFGRKAADVTTRINAVSTLRWFGGEDVQREPAYQNLVTDLEDNQTLLLLAALLLEIGFFDVL